MGTLILVACAGRPHPRVMTQAEGSTPSAARHLHPLVHFETGSTAIDPEAIGLLTQNVEWLKAQPTAVVLLEGHCDERGGDHYNMELGDRRARRVKGYLMAHGVDPDQAIMIVSYGERRPLDQRHTAEAWRENRRVEFIVR